MLDVVTVPDFSEVARAKFEARTKLFLTSWLQNSTPGVQLHIAAIGEPPESVRSLADRANARLSVHSAVGNGVFENKRRAFELPPTADWLLLVDTDVLFMERLAIAEPPSTSPAIYAAPADRTRFDPARWPELYRCLGLSPPPQTMTLLKGRMVRKFRSTFPFYNGGVLLIHWSLVPELSSTWAEHYEGIAAYTKGREGFEEIGDQESLATALHVMNAPVRILPDRYNTSWRHLYLGHGPDAVSIYHATGFLWHYRGGPLEPQVHSYRKSLRNKFLRAAWESPASVYRLPGALRRLDQIAARLSGIVKSGCKLTGTPT